MTSTSRCASCLVVAAGVLLRAGALGAADFTWTPTTAGAYAWDNAGGQDNWGTGAGGAFPNDAGDNATLSVDLAGDQTIQLNVPVTIRALTLNDAGTDPDHAFMIVGNGGSFIFDNGAAAFTLANNSVANSSDGTVVAADIALASNLTVTAGTGSILAFSGNLAETGGSRSLTKSGAGTLILTGTTTHTAGTTVSAGKLILDGATVSPSMLLTVNTGANVGLELAADSTVGRLSGNGAVDLGDHTLTLHNSNLPAGNASHTGSIGGDAGSLVQTGAMAQTLSGANTFGSAGGSVTIIGTGPRWPSNVTLNPGLAFGNSNAYTGATTVSDAALSLSGLNGAITNSASLALTNSWLYVAETAASVNPDRIGDNAPVAMSAAALLYVGVAASTETLGQITLGSGGSYLTRITDGTITLGNAGVAPFVRSVPGSTLQITSPALGGFVAPAIAPDTFLGGWALVGTSWTKTDADNKLVAFALGDYQAGSTPNNWTATDHVRVGAGLAGPLTASNTIASLNLASAQTLTIGAGTTLTVGSGGILASANATIGATDGTSTLKSGLAQAEGNDLIVSVSNQRTLTINAVIADGAAPGTALTKSGPVSMQGPTGILVLNGQNTYTGPTIINSGVVRATDGVGLPSASVLVLQGNPGVDRTDGNGMMYQLGVFQTSGTFTRSLGAAGTDKIMWGVGGGGFAAFGGPLTVNINGNATPDTLIWGETPYFVGGGGKLAFGSVGANNRVEFVNPINLNDEIRVIVGNHSGGASTLLSGNISSTTPGLGSLVYSSEGGAALIIATGQNTYGGPTIIEHEAVLRADDGVGLPATSNLKFTGRSYSQVYLETNGVFTRSLGDGPGQVQFVTQAAGQSNSGSGGFSAYGGPLVVRLGDGNDILKLNTAYTAGLRGSMGLCLNSPHADNVVDFQTDIDLNGVLLPINANDNPGSPNDYAIISGQITNSLGTGGIQSYYGNGLVVLANDNNTYDSPTTLTSRGTMVFGFTSIADVGAGPSALGAPSDAAKGMITIQGGGIRYLGTDPAGHSSNRDIRLTGTGRVDASGVGPLVLESGITVDNNRNLTLGGTGMGEQQGAIGLGTGTLTKADSGLWVLGAASSYTGSTTLAAGALRAEQGVGLPTDSLLIIQNGVLETSGTFARALGAGAGQVQWTSSTANAGGFSAFGGPLNVRLGDSTSEVIWATGNFASTGGLRFGSAWADDVVTFENDIALANTSTSNTTRTIRVDDNPDTDADYAVLSGTLRNASSTGLNNGIRKVGDGTLVLTGANTYTGATTLDEGTLLVNNTSGSGTGTGPVAVAGGTLGGTGTIGGNVVQTGGTISPGASPGTLTVAGDLTSAAAGMMLFEIGGMSQGSTYDLLDVGGSVVLTDTGLTVALVGGFRPKFTNQATIIEAAAVSGTFDANATMLLPADVLAGVRVVYNPDSVVLTDFDLFPLASIRIRSLGGGMFEFDGTGSHDPDDADPADYTTLTKFEWDLGTGTLVDEGLDSIVTGPLTGGVHIIRLQVTDNEGTIGLISMTYTVPEPGAFALLGLAMAGLGLRRRRT